MIFFIVSWISFACPMFVGKMMPESLKQFVCTPTVESESVDKKEDVYKILEDLGPLKTLRVCKASKGTARKSKPKLKCLGAVEWIPKIKG